MTPEQFCYWLQGLLEGNPEMKSLSELQIKIIQEHLNTVFNKVTPSTQSLLDALRLPDPHDAVKCSRALPSSTKPVSSGTLYC